MTFSCLDLGRLSIIFFLICSCSYRIEKNSNEKPAEVNQQYLATSYIQKFPLKVCLDCHAGQESPDLDTPDRIKSHFSSLQTKINNNDMPPLDQGYTSLSDCEKASVNKWIELGMPDESTIFVSSLPECATGTASSLFVK